MLNLRLIISCVLLGTALWSGASASEILLSGADGWHTWQVDEPGASTAMCCYTRKRGVGSAGGCNLEGRNVTFSNHGDCAAAPGMVQFYVRLEGGTPRDIHVLSSLCAVSTASPIFDHGKVTAYENLSWFRAIIEDPRIGKDVREAALFALVQSNSDKAYAYLDNLLSRR